MKVSGDACATGEGRRGAENPSPRLFRAECFGADSLHAGLRAPEPTLSRGERVAPAALYVLRPCLALATRTSLLVSMLGVILALSADGTPTIEQSGVPTPSQQRAAERRHLRSPTRQRGEPGPYKSASRGAAALRPAPQPSNPRAAERRHLRSPM